MELSYQNTVLQLDDIMSVVKHKIQSKVHDRGASQTQKDSALHFRDAQGATDHVQNVEYVLCLATVAVTNCFFLLPLFLKTPILDLKHAC